MKKKYIQLMLWGLLVGTHINAQNLNGAYFMDGFTNGHEMNPAKGFERRGYVSIPVLGNINAGVKGNLALKDVLFKNPNGSGLVTYLHPDISTAEALDGISNKNKLNADVRINIINVGFHAFNGFNTIALNSRTHAGVSVPGELFRLTKNLENKDYHVDKTKATASSWAELAFGHSHQVNEAWRVGGKFKILMGVAYSKMDVNQLDLELSSEDQWRARAHASAEMGIKNFTWGEPKIRDYSNQYPGHMSYEEIDFDNIDVDKFGLNGAGMAIDMGAEWDLEKANLLDGFKISASLLDLGFIRWKNVATAYNNGDDFQFDGFNDIKVKDGDGTEMRDQTDDLSDRLSDLYSLREGEYTSKTRGIGATLNLGAEYTLQSYKNLKFGFLSTTRIQGTFSWNEERISACLTPIPWLDLSASLATGTIGTNIGWVVNIHPKGFQFFVGSDHCIGKLSKQFVPLKRTYDFCMGISIPFGEKRI